MKIETEFDIGENVFFIKGNGNTVKHGTISEINVNVNHSGPLVDYRIEGLMGTFLSNIFKTEKEAEKVLERFKK